jgi:tripartite-type tricarboxylate transporter receptor subunit TctC
MGEHGRGRRAALLALAGAALPAMVGMGRAAAQGTSNGAGSYPDRPIRLIVPGPTSGAADVVSRIVADRLQRALGQTIVVENRPGATTNVGTQAVARSPADGYTLGVASAASHGANQALFRSLPFDPVADFAPISLMAVVPNLMVVPMSLPATSIREFIDHVKARPGEVNYGSVGPGSSQHLAGVQFDLLAGTRMVHVPYTQSGQMNTDLMEGRVQVLFQSVSSVAELVRAGRMRALACSGAERLAAFPQVPTLREEGVDITTQGWFGLVTPAGVPEPILERLHAATMEALRDPETVARLVQSGALPRPQTRAEFARFIAGQMETLGALVRASGATLN